MSLHELIIIHQEPKHWPFCSEPVNREMVSATKITVGASLIIAGMSTQTMCPHITFLCLHVVLLYFLHINTWECSTLYFF